MFFWKYKEKILSLENRIAYLEDKLCPCESHDWHTIGKEMRMISSNDFEYLITYKCSKCGKVIKKFEFM